MHRFVLGVLIIGMFSVPCAAQIQPGSTGGSIGKTEKSISGGESTAETHTPTSSRSKGQRPINKGASQLSEVSAAGTKCARIVGTWNWVSGEVTAKSDGTYTYAVGGDSGVGKWSCSGGAHIVLRGNGHEDRMTLSDDGLKMTGVSWVTNFTVPFSVHKRQ
jgi:hypothetical protein